MDRETLLDLIPGYALGALDADEQREVEALLAQDAEARALLAEYEEMTDMLVLAVPAQAAPAHLSDDLRRRLRGDSAPASSRPLPAAKPVTPLLPRLLALAAMLAVVIGLAALLASLQPATPEGAQLYTQLAGQENAMRVALVPNEEQPQLEGELVAVPGSTQVVIEVRNLAVLPEDQIYQLWIVGPEGITSGGLFNAAEDAPTYVVVPITLPVENYAAFGVSLEPAGGSPFPDRPTGSGVFRVPLEPA